MAKYTNTNNMPQDLASALAEIASLRAQAAANTRAFTATHVTGVSKKTGKPYTGIRLTGNFAPVYLSDTAAAEVAQNASSILAALKRAPEVRQ